LRISRRAGLAALAGVALVVVLIWQAWTRLAPSQHHPTNSNASASGAATPGKTAEADDSDDQDAEAAPPAPARPAGSWIVDRAASRLTFRGVMDGAPFDGVFRSWSARIAFDPNNLKGSKAVITIDAESALTGQPIKDEALPNAEWLDTARHPQATLITRSITQVAPGRYQAVADVRIRGFLRRTTVPFTIAINRDVGHMESTLTLDRRDFHIGEGPWRSPPPVAPAFQVTMRLVAKRAR
jgi:polyisoprenoid-binding protein YceI